MVAAIRVVVSGLHHFRKCVAHFHFICWHGDVVRGGFFLRKKPLGFEVSVNNRGENAVAASEFLKAPIYGIFGNTVVSQSLLEAAAP